GAVGVLRDLDRNGEVLRPEAEAAFEAAGRQRIGVVPVVFAVEQPLEFAVVVECEIQDVDRLQVIGVATALGGFDIGYRLRTWRHVVVDDDPDPTEGRGPGANAVHEIGDGALQERRALPEVAHRSWQLVFFAALDGALEDILVDEADDLAAVSEAVGPLLAVLELRLAFLVVGEE